MRLRPERSDVSCRPLLGQPLRAYLSGVAKANCGGWRSGCELLRAGAGSALLVAEACAALQDWHMLHANEAWRQLTGAELQRGVSTGLWESFEFLAVQPQASPHLGDQYK